MWTLLDRWCLLGPLGLSSWCFNLVCLWLLYFVGFVVLCLLVGVSFALFGFVAYGDMRVVGLVSGLLFFYFYFGVCGRVDVWLIGFDLFLLACLLVYLCIPLLVITTSDYSVLTVGVFLGDLSLCLWYLWVIFVGVGCLYCVWVGYRYVPCCLSLLFVLVLLIVYTLH